MSLSLRVATVSALLLLCPGAIADDTSPALGWPVVQREHRPWTRWWWPGSAVDAPGLTQQLEEFARVGLGGVEVTPIYAAIGHEARELPFLSPPWIDALAHTTREAGRLGLGVDMATGTGWPFGGPWVEPADALHRVRQKDGRLAGEPTGMRVKRAAPGGAGLVLDPFSTPAMERYLEPIGRALAALPPGAIRSQFHDSFEYFDAGWTPTLAAEFERRHHYDLNEHVAELFGDGRSDTVRRLKSDYRETLAHLHLQYLTTWVNWSHRRGYLTRNQSHGAPANLLDLYGAVDIPETETFGSTPFPIPGLRRDPADVRSSLDLPEPLVIRLAASAAHVSGRRLASSETCTWLREHWKTSLAFAKPEIDRLFACGINHIFYHGTVYSPRDAAWPGWLFYASTEFYPTNPWWDDFAALNAYVTRVQSVLQSGRPDPDVLVYWPFSDVIDAPQGLANLLTVHEVGWLRDAPAGRLGAQLTDAGLGFDFISDAQLNVLRVEAGQLMAPGSRYRALLVPAVRRMPLETLRRLLDLAAVVPVLFASPPEDVPGLGRLAERRAAFQTLLPAVAPHVVADLASALAARGIRGEPAARAVLSLIRRGRDDVGHDYFFANLAPQPVDGWIGLARSTAGAVILDPMSGAGGRAALRLADDGSSQVFLQLDPGESILLRTTAEAFTSAGRPWPYTRRAGEPLTIGGRWHIEFLKGGPELPPPLTTETLRSWTELGGDAAGRFAGTARYRLEFDAPSAGTADDWELDLGDVRESARVRLNGQALGTVWSLPFRLRIGRTLRPGRNVLELEVTNLAANRIRDLDRRNVSWKTMREINFVDINYRPFDASGWPVTPSGLLGPVRLIPLRTLDPTAVASP